MIPVRKNPTISHLSIDSHFTISKAKLIYQTSPPFNPRLPLSSPPPQGLYIATSLLSKAIAIAPSSPCLPSALLVFLNPFLKPTPQISSLASDMQNPRVQSPSSPTSAATCSGHRSTCHHSFSVDWCFSKPMPQFSSLASDM